MFLKSERQCPNCFRTLRVKTNSEGLYCPDTFQCQWTTAHSRSRQKLSAKHLQEGLEKAHQENDHQKVQRIKALLLQHYPNGVVIDG